MTLLMVVIFWGKLAHDIDYLTDVSVKIVTWRPILFSYPNQIKGTKNSFPPFGTSIKHILAFGGLPVLRGPILEATCPDGKATCSHLWGHGIKPGLERSYWAGHLQVVYLSYVVCWLLSMIRICLVIFLSIKKVFRDFPDYPKNK